MENKMNNGIDNFKRRKDNKVKRLMSYMFLYLGYIFLSWVTEISFDASATEIGVLLCATLLSFSIFIYVIVNHLFISKVLSYKISLIFEVLILTFICLKFLMAKFNFFQSIIIF